MKNYTITWKIELLATNPQQAAIEALDSIINGTAKVFDVIEAKDRARAIIDLEEVTQ